jgi:hypothetical protein
MTVPPTSVVVNGFEVFESSKPHTVWGLALPLHDKEKDRNGTTFHPRSHHATSSSSSSSSNSSSSSSSSSYSSSSSNSSSSSSSSQKGTTSDAVTNVKLQAAEQPQPSHNLFKSAGAVKPTLSLSLPGPSLNATAPSCGTVSTFPHTVVTIEVASSTGG